MLEQTNNEETNTPHEDTAKQTNVDQKELTHSQESKQLKQKRSHGSSDENHEKSVKRNRRDTSSSNSRSRSKSSSRSPSPDRHRDKDSRYSGSRYDKQDKKFAPSYHKEGNSNISRSNNNFAQWRNTQPGVTPALRSAAEKRKLLWSKKETPLASNWNNAEFDSEHKKDKFLHLIGAKKPATYDPLNPTAEEEEENQPKEKVSVPTQVQPPPPRPPPLPPLPPVASEGATKTLLQQNQLYADLEKIYEGARFRVGHKGLGNE